MRKLGAWVVAAALLGVLASAARAQPPQFGGTTWGPGKAKPDDGRDSSDDKKDKAGDHKTKADDKKDKADDKKSENRPSGPSPAERTAKELKRHENALVRRMQVCDRLRRIALDTNDADLERQADELEEQAKAAYQRHAARLGVSTAAARGKPDQSTEAPRDRATGEARRAGREGEDKP
jgi:hypothetical protein